MTEGTGTGHEAGSTAACPSDASSFVRHRNTEGESNDLLHTGQRRTRQSLNWFGLAPLGTSNSLTSACRDNIKYFG